MISPVANSYGYYGYLIGYDHSGNFSATAIDLNPGSKTFGQLLPQTGVNLSLLLGESIGAAISRDGASLVVTSWTNFQIGPQNTVVVNTNLMFTNPGNAIVGQATVGNGERTGGVTVASITTTPPASAPTVTGVSGQVTNNAPTTIHVEGTNFLPGAQVRIGKMQPLPATVNSSSDLQVTVPQNAPAAPQSRCDRYESRDFRAAAHNSTKVAYWPAG